MVLVGRRAGSKHSFGCYEKNDRGWGHGMQLLFAICSLSYQKPITPAGSEH